MQIIFAGDRSSSIANPQVITNAANRIYSFEVFNASRKLKPRSSVLKGLVYNQVAIDALRRDGIAGGLVTQESLRLAVPRGENSRLFFSL